VYCISSIRNYNWCIQSTLKYKERKLWNRIFNHQAIAFKLADMYHKVTAAKMLVMKQRKDEGKDITHSGAM
jgi:alkylation response protein AidB-like acyl-CoA dehydrogenase